MQRAETRTVATRIEVLAARGAVAGALGGLALAGVVMLSGLVTFARTPWDAPMAIWAWAFGIEHFGTPSEHIWPIVLGAGAHLVNSLALGAVLGLLAGAIARRDVATALVFGLLYGLGVWVVMRYFVLPANEDEATLFTSAVVAPQWVWWLGHAADGTVAGLVLHALARLTRAPVRARPAEERFGRAA